jgi:uncharacterized protein
MKKIFGIGAISLLFLNVSAQKKSPVGRWEGILNVGIELRIVFNVKEEPGGKLSATTDSPDQSAYDIPVDSVTFQADTLSFFLSALQASYIGHMVNDSVIQGELMQGIPFPLTLKRTAKKSGEKVRAQTPVPPYPYREEKITYFNADSSIKFGATLTIPQGKGPFPALVLISGSGPQDRNSNVLGHALFHVLADHLTKNGVIVLRYDERGIGESSGVFAGATSADFAKDVHTAVDQLLLRSETDRKKIGLVGHSEGGMIAPMVASSRKDVSFLVLLAAPGVPTIELMALQNEAIALSNGMSESLAKNIGPLFKGMTYAITGAETNDQARTGATAFLNDWTRGKDSSTLESLNLLNPAKREEYLLAMVEQLRSPWFLYFTRFDPTPNLQKLTGKVLALNGTRDIQVIHSQNLSGIASALKKSKVRKFEIREIEGLNHLFQSCRTCTLDEYRELDESFSPVALNMISDWINKEIK